MSETDRAFIKAYQQGYAAPHPVPRPSVRPAVSYPMPAPAASPDTQRRVDVPSAAAVAPAARVPTPHLQVAATAAIWTAPTVSRATQNPQASAPTTPPNASAKQQKANGGSATHATINVNGAAWGHATTRPSPSAPPPLAPVERPPAAAALRIEEALTRIDGDVGEPSPLEVVEDSPLRVVMGQFQTPGDTEDTKTQTADSPENTHDQKGETTEEDGRIGGAVEEIRDAALPECTDTPDDSATEAKSPDVAAAESGHAPSSTDSIAGKASIADNANDPVEAATRNVFATDANAPSELAEDDVDGTKSPPAAPFQPQWEVDAFQWPELIDQLTSQANEEIVAACESLSALAEEGHNIVAIAGVTENCGTTTLALTLARQLAAGGLRIALVDADFDNADLAQRLGVRVENGWEATLGGRLPADEVAIASVDDNVVLVPLVAGEGVSSTLASMNAAAQIKTLAADFDMVVIDAGSGSENAAAVATSSDEVLDMTVLLAVDERNADPAEVDEVIARLNLNQLGNVQLAETFA